MPSETVSAERPTHFCDDCRRVTVSSMARPRCLRCGGTMLPVEFLRPVEGGQGRDADELVRDTRDIVFVGAVLLGGAALVIVVLALLGGAS